MAAPSLSPLVINSSPSPRVSVVMPAHNRAEQMRLSVQSIREQTLRDFELIIVDDGSTDGTPDAAEALVAEDSRIGYVRIDKAGGVANALNTGICASRASLVQVCHDHDFYLPTLLERLASILERHERVVFAHPGLQWCDHLGKPVDGAVFVSGYPEVSEGRVWLRRMLRSLASPVTALSMVRRAALEKVGLFDPDFGVTTDVEMWLRLCGIGDVGYANELLIRVRGREPGHPFAERGWEIRDEVIRAHRKHLGVGYPGWRYGPARLRSETTIDLHLLFDYLNSYRHGWWDDVRRGRSHLRKNGVLLSRIAAWVL
jgi:glycosyltransferase involved in cell wall biosynthesis